MSRTILSRQLLFLSRVECSDIRGTAIGIIRVSSPDEELLGYFLELLCLEDRSKSITNYQVWMLG